MDSESDIPTVDSGQMMRSLVPSLVRANILGLREAQRIQSEVDTPADQGEDKPYGNLVNHVDTILQSIGEEVAWKGAIYVVEILFPYSSHQVQETILSDLVAPRKPAGGLTRGVEELSADIEVAAISK